MSLNVITNSIWLSACYLIEVHLRIKNATWSESWKPNVAASSRANCSECWAILVWKASWPASFETWVVSNILCTHYKFQSHFSQDCIDTSVMVLTSNVWPMSATVTFEIAPGLKKSMDKFSEFYQAQHNGRRLAFLLVSSRGEISANCFAKKYTFLATVAQISILNLFNTSTTFTQEQIQSELKMKPELLSAALQAIVKTEILLVTEGTLDGPNPTLALNDAFQK